jgi:hypothetical protein
MNHNLFVWTKGDPDLRRKRALAKVYDLLIKLAEEKEKETADTEKDYEKPALLKMNIPVGQ